VEILHPLRFHAFVALAPVLRPLLAGLDFSGGFRFAPFLAASPLALDHRLASRLAFNIAGSFRSGHRRRCRRGRSFRDAILDVVFLLQTLLLVLGHRAPLLAAGFGVLRRSRRRNRKGEPDRCRRICCNEKTSFHLATSLLAQTYRRSAAAPAGTRSERSPIIPHQNHGKYKRGEIRAVYMREKDTGGTEPSYFLVEAIC